MSTKIVSATTNGAMEPRKVSIRRATQIEQAKIPGIRYVLDGCPGGSGIASVKTSSFAPPQIAIHTHSTAQGKVVCSYGGEDLILPEGVKLDF